jgi:serine/threonine protein kinase
MLTDNGSTYHNTRYFSDASFEGVQMAQFPYDFVTFLDAIEKLRVRILPVTWQAARQPIGTGATSRINEAFVTLHRSFAFKCASEHQKKSEPEGSTLRMILNECSILSHPSIRRHPNVIELEGVCWDIEPKDKIWPVLVYDKTHWGDLDNFAVHLLWRNLTAGQRLSLCMDIGAAISCMHSNSEYAGSCILAS